MSSSNNNSPPLPPPMSSSNSNSVPIIGDEDSPTTILDNNNNINNPTTTNNPRSINNNTNNNNNNNNNNTTTTINSRRLNNNNNRLSNNYLLPTTNTTHHHISNNNIHHFHHQQSGLGLRKVMSQLSTSSDNTSDYNNHSHHYHDNHHHHSTMHHQHQHDDPSPTTSNTGNHNHHHRVPYDKTPFHSTSSFNSLSSYYNPLISPLHRQHSNDSNIGGGINTHHQHNEHLEHTQQHHVHYFKSPSPYSSEYDDDEFDIHLYPPPPQPISKHDHDDHIDEHGDEHHDDHHNEEHPMIILGKYHPHQQHETTAEHQHELNTLHLEEDHKKSSNNSTTINNTINTNTNNNSNSNKKDSLSTYFKRKYLGFEQHLLLRSDKHRDSEYRSQLELITAIDEHCDSVLHSYTSVRMFILSLLGGIFVSIGTLLSALLSSDLSSKAMQKLMVGIAFVGGFTMIIFSKSILFTEVNISVSVHLFKNDLIGIIRRGLYYLFKGVFSCFKNHLHLRIRRPHKSIKIMTLLNSLKLWSISIVGNILGTVLMSAILSASYVWYDNQSVIQFLSSLTRHKIHLFEEKGANGWFSCLLSGMVANFMIGVATLLCTAGTTIMGKILALFFPIIAFAALGVQHAPANVGYFSHIYIWKSMYGESGSSSSSGGVNITMTNEIKYVMEQSEWFEGIYWNLIPAAIGNALGGFFLAFVFVFIFIK